MSIHTIHGTQCFVRRQQRTWPDCAKGTGWCKPSLSAQLKDIFSQFRLWPAWQYLFVCLLVFQYPQQESDHALEKTKAVEMAQPVHNLKTKKQKTQYIKNKLRCFNHFQVSANQISWFRLLIQIHILNNDKQCRSRSVGFFRSLPIWIYTVCKCRAYAGSARSGWGGLDTPAAFLQFCTRQLLLLHVCFPAQKSPSERGLLFNERICSKGEQILSFKRRPLFRRKANKVWQSCLPGLPLYKGLLAQQTRIPRKASSHLLAQKSQEPQSECGY